MQTKKIIGDYEFMIQDVLGKGYSSTVYLGKKVSTQEQVAIKVINMKEIKNEVKLHLLKAELSVLSRLDNPYVLAVRDIFQTANNTYIITEYCNDGDLAALLEKKGGKFPESEAVRYLTQLVKGYQVRTHMQPALSRTRNFPPSIKITLLPSQEFYLSLSDGSSVQLHLAHSLGRDCRP